MIEVLTLKGVNVPKAAKWKSFLIFETFQSLEKESLNCRDSK